jgi:hypothetical protein
MPWRKRETKAGQKAPDVKYKLEKPARTKTIEIRLASRTPSRAAITPEKKLMKITGIAKSERSRPMA